MPCVLRGVATVKGIAILELEQASKTKPEGYLNDVLSYVARRTDTHVVLKDADYYMLRAKYSGDVDPVHRGPGTELHKLLAKFGIHMASGCACRARMTQMNKWGIAGCEQNVETIVEWMKEEAAKRKLPYLNTVGRILVRRAISNARREEERVKGTA
jgi:hypothetical protein